MPIGSTGKSAEQISSAFLCQSGPNDGNPHEWIYLKDLHKNYRCSRCLVVVPKARLKELTDDA